MHTEAPAACLQMEPRPRRPGDHHRSIRAGSLWAFRLARPVGTGPTHWIEGDKTVVYLPWQILFCSTTASLSGIVVSLFTPPVSANKLNRFYQLSRTPVQPGEEVLQPCTLPETTPRVDRRMLLTAGGLELPKPSKTSTIGFMVAWIFVGGIVGAFNWIVSW